ncbi:MAG: cyclic nucleotide-binding domain-containing protein [Thermodesulfobacteriota bacterium]|nr:cyclic nucleotide-binding domain-containing protein [Thermodesulfobacteriota bacterium]
MKESPYLEDNKQYIESMKKMAVFQSLKDNHLKEILRLSKIRKYDPEEPIILEGEYGNWMYFIISGQVRVEKQGKKISALRRTGDVFGEMGIIDGSSRSASVYANEKTMCLAVDASFLDRMNEADRTTCYSVLYRLFAHILAERLRTANEELAGLKKEMAGAASR